MKNSVSFTCIHVFVRAHNKFRENKPVAYIGSSCFAQLVTAEYSLHFSLEATKPFISPYFFKVHFDNILTPTYSK